MINSGALIEKRTFQGFSCLHIASQADQILSIVYFHDKGADLNALDSKGSSPLHWAAYTGCENAINYLTRYMLDINRKDDDQGYTALHLATITGNSKIVRRLLIKGADCNISDKIGKKPADLAKDNHFHNIFNMLENPYKVMECYQITPNFHIKGSKASFITFWIAFFLLNIVFVAILMACIEYSIY